MGTDPDSTTILPVVPLLPAARRRLPAGLNAVAIGGPAQLREAMAAAGRAARKAALPANPYLRAFAVRFRLPMPEDPAPTEHRIAVLCLWAALLGLGGAVLTLRLIVTMFMPNSDWYGAVVVLLGLVGLPATIGAFASIHRRRLPWVLLGVGTATLLTAYAAA